MARPLAPRHHWNDAARLLRQAARLLDTAAAEQHAGRDPGVYLRHALTACDAATVRFKVDAEPKGDR